MKSLLCLVVVGASTGCLEDVDDPYISIALADPEPAIRTTFRVNVEDSGGCAAVERLTLMVDGDPVDEIRWNDDELAQSFELDLRGRSYEEEPPPMVSVALECESGQIAGSDALMLPPSIVASREFASEQGWPSYDFAFEPGGSFLFCDDGLVRMTASGESLTRSNVAVRCPTESVVEIAGEVVVVHAPGELGVFGRDQLEHRWSAQGVSARFDADADLAVIVEESEEGLFSLSVRTLSSGDERWRVTLAEDIDGPRRTITDAVPVGDRVRAAGYVFDLSGAGSDAAMAWDIGPDGVRGEAQLYPLPAASGPLGMSTVSPTVWLTIDGETTLVHHDGVLRVVDVGTGQERSRHPVEQPHRFYPMGDGTLVRAPDGLVRLDERGEIVATSDAAVGQILGAHPVGGVYGSYRLDDETTGMLHLSPGLGLDWELPGELVGVAFEPDGTTYAVRPPGSLFEL